MEALHYLTEIASNLKNAEVERWKQDGGRVVGTICSNVPEEVLFAAGVLPVRLRAPGLEDTSTADSHLHRMNCSYARSVLEFLLRGDMAFFDGLVTINTCDHLLRLAGEIADKAQLPLVHCFSMYHALGGSSTKWYILEMQKLIRHIEEAFETTITDDDLRRAISLCNQTRRLMIRLDDLRKWDPAPLSGAEYLGIAIAGMSMPRERFNEKLEELLPELEARKAGKSGQARLMVIGGACDLPEFIRFIEQKGAIVVSDGLCFGMRHYRGTIKEEAESPLQAIAERYAGRAVCPSVMNGFDQNLAILREIIDEWKVDGVICARLKFCDSWAGERKLLSEELRKDGIPLLELEREYHTTGSGQISTRVQAFLEMLGS